MSDDRLTVVGGGQMGRALVGGIISGQMLDATNLRIVEPDAESRAWWERHHAEVKISDDLAAMVDGSGTVLLAVKPHVVAPVLSRSTPLWQDRLVISIAAGITLEKLCSWTGHHRVIRVMPNTPSLVGEGASAICGADDVTADDYERIESLLNSVGIVVRVAESQMDAVTGLSGSGPAYVFIMIEALADGGVKAGLPRPLAMKLATQTVLGAAKMVAESGRHPGELKDAVASPAGTTIAAIATLEQNGVRGALIEAVAASAKRSRELQ